MSIVTSPRDVERFTPAHYADPDRPGPVYLIAPLTFRERARLEGDLTAAGAGTYPSDAQLVAGVRAAVAEVAPDNLDGLLADIDAFSDLILAEPLGARPGEPARRGKAALADQVAHDAEAGRRRTVEAAYRVIEAAMAGVPVSARLRAARVVRGSMFPPMLVAFALRGWSGADHLPPFRRVNGVVPDALVDALPREDVAAISERAALLMRPTETERKN